MARGRKKMSDQEKEQVKMERKNMTKVEILKKRQAELEAKIKLAEVEETEKGKYRPVRKACTQIQRAKAALAEAESLLIDGEHGIEAEKLYDIRINHLASIMVDLETYLGKHSSDVDPA